VGLVFLFTACTESNTSGEKSNLSSLDSNTANNASAISSDEILVQGFTQIPSIINNCSALFVKDTTEQAQTEYVFVTNLKGLAFIKLNNRLMELKLIKQTNVDKYTVNELYVNDEVEIDLKIRELEEGKNAKWNYNGVLIIRRGAKREAITIAGKLGC
jgi:hypothetical protein